MLEQERQESLDSQIKTELERIGLKDDKVVSKDIKSELVPKDIKSDADPFLEEALKMGFDPKFDGPGKKSAEQFVKDGSFFKKINELKKEVEETKNLAKQSLEHNVRLEKAAYDKAIADIKEQRRQAVLEANVKQVDFLDDRERILKTEQANVTIPSPKIQVTQELLDFQERNKDWFNNLNDENREMVEAADTIDKFIGRQAMERGIKLTQLEQLTKVEERIQKLYSHRFKNENQEKPSLVAKSTTPSREEKKSLADRLTKDQRKYVEQARKLGGKLTNEEYARQLDMTGRLQDA